MHVEGAKDAKILPILVTPATKAKTGAEPHLKEVALWPLAEYCLWAKEALLTVRAVRRTFSEVGDIVWRVEAAERFEAAGLDASSIFEHLQHRTASQNLEIVP